MLLPASALAAAGIAGATSRVVVELPASSLEEALVGLGQQANISIVFATSAVNGLTTPGLRSSDLSAVDALQRLLSSHCLKAQQIRQRVFAVRSGCSTRELSSQNEAEPVTPGPFTPPAIEEIYVSEEALTGTRLRGPSATDLGAIEVIDRAEIEHSGAQAIDQILRYVPAVAGNSTSTLISNGGDGTATVTLRGLPASNTLVLLNGRRLNPDAFGGGSVDLNSLPLALIERVEILKDGASALYGSDAVAGVVNVITRNRVNGVHLDTYYGQAGAGDLNTLHTSMIAGRSQSAWEWTAGASYYDQSQLPSSARALSASSDDRPRGGIDKRSSATAPARLALPSGTVILNEGSTGAVPGDYRAATLEDRYEYRGSTSSIVPSRRWSAFLDARAFVGNWELFTEHLWSDQRSETRFAPAPLFTAFETVPVTVAADQAFNPFGTEIVDLRRRMVELGDRVQQNEVQTRRSVIGAQGELAGTFVEVLLAIQSSRGIERFTGGMDTERTLQGLSGNCPPPCVPLNVFGAGGALTDDMVDFIRTSTRLNGRSYDRSLSLNLDRSLFRLPAGRIELAAGAEIRRESLKIQPDGRTQRGVLGATTTGATDGDRSVWEAFAELWVPLLSAPDDRSLLDLQLAGRVSQYNDFGRASNPRLRLNWRPHPSVAFRASYAHGFRAPTLKQLFGGDVVSFETLNDPCVAANTSPLTGCQGPADASITQVLTRIGGFDQLEPETSRTLNVGVTWAPKRALSGLSLDGLTFAVDAWRIRQRNVVDSSAQYIINENARSGRFADRVPRNSDGNITSVDASLLNIGTRDVAGVDVAARYNVKLERFGAFELAVNASHIERFVDRFDPDSPRLEQAGRFWDAAAGGNGALPAWKANLGVRWQRGPWGAAYTLHYVDSLREVVPVVLEERQIEAWQSHDLQASYAGPATADVRVTLGLDNAFDEAPPFAAAAFNDSYDGRTYDITGRYWYLRLDRFL